MPPLLRFTPAETVAAITAQLPRRPAQQRRRLRHARRWPTSTGLCPTLLVNAEYDDLRSSGEAFAAALATAGVDVRQVLARGMLHGFLNLSADIEPVGRRCST